MKSGKIIVTRYSLPMKGYRIAMTRTPHEYRQRWQAAMTPECTVAPWDEELSPTSCVIFESPRVIPMGEWCTFFADFGDAICFYRYLRIPEELETVPTANADELAQLAPTPTLEPSRWDHYRARFSNEEIRRRRYEGERALDKLLERFVREGYRPDMAQKLIETVATTLIDSDLHAIYVLPGDLSLLLAHIGNPFAECDFMLDEEEDGATPAAPAFDLNAQGHRKALAERLIEPQP
ncbi:MAG TPA: hypothetical protein VJR48_12640 [Ktedonobacterales bacterium]|nr:hypothetical protein [Ktedonobacterales bacterium]